MTATSSTDYPQFIQATLASQERYARQEGLEGFYCYPAIQNRPGNILEATRLDQGLLMKLDVSAKTSIHSFTHETPTRGERSSCARGTSPMRTSYLLAISPALNSSLGVGLLKISGRVARRP